MPLRVDETDTNCGRVRRIGTTDRMSGPESGSRPVRVCFMIDRLALAGTEGVVRGLVHHLDRKRIEPSLVLLDGEDEVSRALEPLDCPVLRLGVRSLRAPSSIGKMRMLTRFLKRNTVEIIQPYFPDSTYFGICAGLLAGVKIRFRTRNDENYWMTPAHRLIGRMLNSCVTLTICNSESARNAVMRDERPRPERVVIIPNGVDLERFAHIPTHDSGRDAHNELRVGIVANLRHVKGVDQFIEAASLVARAHGNVTFHVAGEGDDRAVLERRIANLELSERCLLHGRVADIPGFLGTLDVAVLSSRSEGMPNALLEYMAAGRPIAAFDVGGVRAVLGSAGLIVPPNDSKGLAQAMCRLLGDGEMAARLAGEARERAATHFSRALMIEKFTVLYERLRAGHSVSAPYTLGSR